MDQLIDLIKFCKCIDIDKMQVRTITNYFSLYLENKLMDFDEILCVVL